MSSNYKQGVIFTPSKIIAHPDAIKISVDSFFKIYDKNHDGRMNRSDIKEALTQIFKDFDVNTKVTDRDVQTFLTDFKIDPSGDISTEDFKGVEFIRFDLQQSISQEKKEEKDIY